MQIFSSTGAAAASDGKHRSTNRKWDRSNRRRYLPRCDQSVRGAGTAVSARLD